MASTLKECLAGQTIIEYPTLYFGSLAHTERLHTLIAEEGEQEAPKVEGRGGIAVISSVETTVSGSSGTGAEGGAPSGGNFVSTHFGYDESDSGDEPMDANGLYGTTEAVPSPDRRVAHCGSSKELLHLGVSNAESDSAISGSNSNTGANGGLPATRFNSSNIADIVGSMKSFIDATLSENKISPAATGNTAGITAANTLFNTTGTAATTSTTTAAMIEDNDSNDSGDDDDDDEEGENSEFLAQLKEYANMDVETLKAIIAAEEAAEALASAEGSNDSSVLVSCEPEDGEVVEMSED